MLRSAIAVVALTLSTAAPAVADDLQLRADTFAALWAVEVATTCFDFGLIDAATLANRELAAQVLTDVAGDFLGQAPFDEIYFAAFDAAQADVAGGDANLFYAACDHVKL